MEFHCGSFARMIGGVGYRFALPACGRGLPLRGSPQHSLHAVLGALLALRDSGRRSLFEFFDRANAFQHLDRPTDAQDKPASQNTDQNCLAL